MASRRTPEPICETCELRLNYSLKAVMSRRLAKLDAQLQRHLARVYEANMAEPMVN